jgi:thymidylate synthase (FAD)
MEIKDETIYLYGDEIGRCDFIQSWGNDIMAVNAARASFGVEKEDLDEKDKKLINFLVKHKHTSVFEHGGITFRCVVPLFVRSQHHRHRTWSYNEISRRYTNVNLQFYEPESFRTQHKSNRQASNDKDLINPELQHCLRTRRVSDHVRVHHVQSIELFDTMIGAGVCREQARGVLPQNLYTTYYASANVSNIIKFIGLRDKPEAQQEIRVLAQAMKKFLEREFPHTAKAMEAGYD